MNTPHPPKLMPVPPLELVRILHLADAVGKMLRRGAPQRVLRLIKPVGAEELVRVLNRLTPREAQKLFGLLERDDFHKSVAVLGELPGEVAVPLLEPLPDQDVARLLAELEPPIAAEHLTAFDDERRDAILERMHAPQRSEVEGTLQYAPDTAGRVMSTEVFALPEDTLVRDAIAWLQNRSGLEDVFYLYVLDTAERLVGVVSLRQLLLNAPDTPLRSMLNPDVIRVGTDTDQEEVAKLVARYDILAIPVVDHNGRLVGQVAVDDVVDIVREEATEDFLRMAGMQEEELALRSPWRSMRVRLPWLLASFAGGLVATQVVGSFGSLIGRIVALAAFIPVINGMGGNVGTQSATIVVSGLATGRLHVRQLWSVLWRELRVAVMLGVFYGLCLGLAAEFLFPQPGLLGLVVGVSMLTSMSIAALVGTFLPMLFKRLHIDPAVATGPFVTTSVDVLGLLSYLGVALLLLP
ncbi:MAG TPA: magnesium transporter [Acidobacteriota bacterium]